MTGVISSALAILPRQIWSKYSFSKVALGAILRVKAVSTKPLDAVLLDNLTIWHQTYGAMALTLIPR